MHARGCFLSITYPFLYELLPGQWMQLIIFVFVFSLMRHLLGVTEEERQIRREEILSTR